MNEMLRVLRVLRGYMLSSNVIIIQQTKVKGNG
jgi:hypothetical protein